MENIVWLTFVPYNLRLLDNATTVKDVVITPVKIAMITRPVRIQMIANTRPGTPTGAISPYPTVVMVTKAHQNPSTIPSAKFLGNCSSFQYVSCIMNENCMSSHNFYEHRRM